MEDMDETTSRRRHVGAPASPSAGTRRPVVLAPTHAVSRRRDRPAGGRDGPLATPSASSAAPPAARPPSGYLDATRTATYGFLAALPLFVLYEVGVLLANRGPARSASAPTSGSRRCSRPWAGSGGRPWAWSCWPSAASCGGASGTAGRPSSPATSVCSSPSRWSTRSCSRSWSAGRSARCSAGGCWPDLALAQLAELGLGLQLALSIGAGLYEELVFRVLLVGGLFWLIQRASSRGPRRAYLIAAVVGAVVFSAVHHMGPSATRSRCRCSRSGSCSGWRSTPCSCCAASRWPPGRTRSTTCWW